MGRWLSYVCLDGSGSDMAQTGEITERWLTWAVGRECRQRAANIYMASFFLPPRKRLAVQGMGAFLNMLEEAMNVAPAGSGGGACASGSELEVRLGMVKERLERMYGGEVCQPEIGARGEDAVIAVVSAAMQRYQIPREWFFDLAEALAMRAGILRIATWKSLEKYLRQRGGSAALIMSAILGLTNPEAQALAVELGTAIELTRVLRDLKKEAQRGRILLPLEDLIRFKYSEKELLRGEVNERLSDLMKSEMERARELYRSGADGIRFVGGDGSRLAAAAMAVLYSGLLRVIERKGFDVFDSELKLSAGQRARRMVDGWRLARGGKARGWERR